jgi:hypothetical protein
LYSRASKPFSTNSKSVFRFSGVGDDTKMFEYPVFRVQGSGVKSLMPSLLGIWDGVRRFSGENVRLPCKGLGFRVWCLGFRVQGSGFRVQSSGFRVSGFGFKSVCWFSGISEDTKMFEYPAATENPHPTLIRRLCWILWELEPICVGIRHNRRIRWGTVLQ